MENYKNSTENKLYTFYRKEKVLPTTTTTTTRDVSKCKMVTSHDSVHTAVHSKIRTRALTTDSL